VARGRRLCIVKQSGGGIFIFFGAPDDNEALLKKRGSLTKRSGREKAAVTAGGKGAPLPSILVESFTEEAAENLENENEVEPVHDVCFGKLHTEERTNLNLQPVAD